MGDNGGGNPKRDRRSVGPKEAGSMGEGRKKVSCTLQRGQLVTKKKEAAGEVRVFGNIEVP